MLDFTGHERFTTAPTGFRDHAWLNRAWQATCECGWVGGEYSHPIDAGQSAMDHAVSEARKNEMATHV